MDAVKKQSHFSEDDLSRQVVDVAYCVHQKMGVGLLESVYEEAFCYLLEKRNIPFERQKGIHAFIDGHDLGLSFKADIVISDEIIIELKSVDKVNENHVAQLMNYMRLSGIQTGFLINFNEQYFKEGIRRFVI